MAKDQATQVKLYEPSKPQVKALEVIHGDAPFITCLNYGRQTGKAQPLSSKIYTKGGFTTMGKLQIGSKILSSDGETEQEVLDIIPQGILPVTRLILDNHENIECNKDHLWTVVNHRGRTRTLSVKRMLRRGVTKEKWCSQCNKYLTVPRFYIKPVKVHTTATSGLSDIELKILAIMLFTGRVKELHIGTDNIGIKETIIEYAKKHKLRIKYSDLKYKFEHNDSLNELLHERPHLIDSIHEWTIREKEIVIDMLKLLTTVTVENASIIRLISSKYADEVGRILNSLGYGSRTIRNRVDGFTDITFANEIEHPDAPLNVKYRAILHIYEAPCEVEMQCITVSGEDSLYITDHHTLTHNSYMSLMDMIYRGMNGDKPLKIRFVTPVYSLAKKHMQTIDAMFQGYEDVKAKIFKAIKYKEQEYHFHNGSIAAFLSAESEDALRGDTAHFMYIDEAAFIKETTYTEILLPMLTRTKGRILMFSTPNGKNWFYKLYNKGLADYKHYNKEQLMSLRADYRDLKDEKDYNHILKTISALRQSMTVASFNREVLAEFVSDQSLFKAVSERIQKKDWYTEYRNSERSKVSTYIGIDIGVVGDFTVLTLLDDNLVVIDIDRFNMQNEGYTHAEFKGRIRAFILKHKERLVAAYMEINNKELLYDELSEDEELYMLMPVNTSMKTKPIMVDALIKRFDDEEITIPDDEDLQEELYAFASIQNPITGRLQYKGTEGQNDDMVMSLVLANTCRDQESSSGFTEVY